MTNSTGDSSITIGENDVVASLAVTLDGYVARTDGAVDYLENYPPDGFEGFDFDAFLAGVGAIVMGRASFEQSVEWGWQWSAYPTLVMTSRSDLEVPDGANVTFSSEPTGDAIRAFRAVTDKRVWVFGGGRVITDALVGDAVDSLDLMMIPEAIGAGIPLYTEAVAKPMRVHETTAYANGALQVIYNLR